MVWNPDDPEGNESLKIKYDIVPYTRGRGLDLGCGMYKSYPHFIGVDNRKQWGKKLPPADEYALRINVDIDCDCETLDFFTSNSMDFVFSSHLLEHIQDARKALISWWRIIKPGGHLVLYLPHANFYPHVGTQHANPDHKHDFLPDDIIKLMRGFVGGWDLLVNEDRNEDREYSFYQVYRKRTDGKQKLTYSIHNADDPIKTCCVQRYGGFGDMIQASSILPRLKDEGYHITFMTTPRGYQIIRKDPHIDDFVIQDDDQVPMEELHDYWQVWQKKFDRFICLTESVEANLLVMPYRVYYGWPSEARHLMCDVNYLQMVHTIAGVDLPPRPRFYPTARESKKARKYRETIKSPVLLWAIDGSSVHKHWPYMHNAMARILTHTDFNIVLVGNELSSLLEQGWEDERRVIKTCGKWSIRQTLAFVEQCDMVIGPETGVLNAAGMLDMPKIIFLSHSSEKNLAKYYRNTISLSPSKDDCPCYPCHKLIYGWKDCVRDDTGALCQTKITLDVFWEAFYHHCKLLSKAA